MTDTASAVWHKTARRPADGRGGRLGVGKSWVWVGGGKSDRVWLVGARARISPPLTPPNVFWPRLQIKLLMVKNHHHASVINSYILHIATSALPIRAPPMVTGERVTPPSHVSQPARGRIEKASSSIFVPHVRGTCIDGPISRASAAAQTLTRCRWLENSGVAAT